MDFSYFTDGCHLKSEAFDTTRWNKASPTVLYTNIFLIPFYRSLIIFADFFKKDIKIHQNLPVITPVSLVTMRNVNLTGLNTWP